MYVRGAEAVSLSIDTKLQILVLDCAVPRARCQFSMNSARAVELRRRNWACGARRMLNLSIS